MDLLASLLTVVVIMVVVIICVAPLALILLDRQAQHNLALMYASLSNNIRPNITAHSY